MDPRAACGRLLDPLGVIEQRPNGEDHEVAAGVQNRRRELHERRPGGGLHDDVGALERLPELEERRMPRQTGQELARPSRVPAGHAREGQAR